ncbi:KAP family P-loop NTPase fold protein [Leclercia pneumoniae]|uniref:KAP family P-loop NTPase fold protein n=1 Tax=Leclercia pneumoniae TaxID=2815358 RepID=UPI0030D40734
MKIKWNWNCDDEYFGEHLPADTLDREKYARYLYDVCCARGEDSNLVININAQWGAGKTYFTKRLAKTINESHPTIYIDAWKEDFSEDPLLTVFSAIKEQLSSQSDKFTQLIDETIENIGPLLRTATPIIVDGLVKKFTGIDNLSELSKSLSEKLLDIHTEKAKKLETIKRGIGTWVEYVKRKDGINKNLPIFVIIDELDRCRPSFSVSLLEITKHIFNIPGVVFVISTDTEQLQHSIKVIYGENFSAGHYLSRFFDRRFLLPSKPYHELLLSKTPDSVIKDFDSLRQKLAPSTPNISTFTKNCASIFNSMGVSLRDAIKLYDRLVDMVVISEKEFDPNLLLILSSYNFINHETYSKIKLKEKLTPTPEYSNVRLNIDLSFATTRVSYIKRNNNHYNNTLEDRDISSHVLTYIEVAWNILNTRRAAAPGSSAYDTPEQWLNGDISDDGSLASYLKMGYANSRYLDNELKIHQYFEYIELSTTFD